MFKKYDQKQQFPLPISLEDFIAEDHIGRILNDIIQVVPILVSSWELLNILII
jgi:transposase